VNCVITPRVKARLPGTDQGAASQRIGYDAPALARQASAGIPAGEFAAVKNAKNPTKNVTNFDPDSPVRADRAQTATAVGMVVIGRNEGARLVRCLESCSRQATAMVYVDSGSTDGSPDAARRLGATVVALDMMQPFTAARARNEGFAVLTQRHPELRRIQFIDGDCELAADWIDTANAFLDGRTDVAAVCGRRLERFPEASLYNRLCDIEWNTPVGEARAFGGDVLLRAEAFAAVGGYRGDLIAGEEPELCVRLRATGWKVWRIGHDMTWHDAAMTRWSQWWKRNMRSGHAFAEGAWLHGSPPERHFVAETRRAVVWGGVLPLLLLIATAVRPELSVLWAIYPLQWLRIGWKLKGQGQPLPWTQSAYFLLGRFAEVAGVARFWWGHSLQRRSAIIEYK
jgi:GT2 family glycosyltransferase